ncbi:predicted protein [Sclerotinia sclerotiorum 1980 UF-70]|uniref:Uncharacterized protein n=1 Tax=Sclerotinia sclerotiorum (strain ATCC 18683 / 1980 / Ss-1) TaxID=665079 RepID=A7F408_SCLS1|nr:predicted protein [Sclerotinia sclerotiorum 1980 UF-70]EDN97479.1 predicted protein [Sclerotinia sclerotiorum 1980 UF-70]
MAMCIGIEEKETSHGSKILQLSFASMASKGPSLIYLPLNRNQYPLAPNT